MVSPSESVRGDPRGSTPPQYIQLSTISNPSNPLDGDIPDIPAPPPGAPSQVISVQTTFHGASHDPQVSAPHQQIMISTTSSSPHQHIEGSQSIPAVLPVNMAVPATVQHSNGGDISAPQMIPLTQPVSQPASTTSATHPMAVSYLQPVPISSFQQLSPGFTPQPGTIFILQPMMPYPAPPGHQIQVAAASADQSFGAAAQMKRFVSPASQQSPLASLSTPQQQQLQSTSEQRSTEEILGGTDEKPRSYIWLSILTCLCCILWLGKYYTKIPYPWEIHVIPHDKTYITTSGIRIVNSLCK